MAKAFNLGEELRKAGGPTVDTREQIEYIPFDLIDPDPKTSIRWKGSTSWPETSSLWACSSRSESETAKRAM